ncbi:MAG: GNAT family N-acetyltransferase [Spirochaetales bacterium]|nr:GNAT family N-acetyltransferase [Spirochaetales bacterium]
MEIRFATAADFGALRRLDYRVAPDHLSDKIGRREIIVAFEDDVVGWLRFGLFWDSIPFMNLLFLLDEFRGKRIGTRLVGFWESEMKKRGFQRVMTSTQSNETAQHFYRKLGYTEIGGMKLPEEPFELFFLKKIGE